MAARVSGILRFVAAKPPFKLTRTNANNANGMASSNVGKWPAAASQQTLPTVRSRYIAAVG